MNRRITSGYFNWYHRRYAPIINKIVSGCSTNKSVRDDMIDVAQRALLLALIQYDRKRSAAIVTFVFRRIKGELSNYCRLEKRQTRAGTINPELMTVLSAPVYADPDARLMVDDVTSHLDPLEKTVLLLTIGHGLSSRQVAKKIGTSHDTVCRFKKSGLRKIRERFPEAVQEEEATAEAAAA